MRDKQALTRGKQLFVALTVVGVAYFFWRAIERNWQEIRAHRFEPNYPLLALALATAVGSGLLATYGWQLTLNGVARTSKMTFARSVATFNSTSLTKYLPGKFWSYALQMYWLSQSGYSKALVLYVNLTNLIASLVTGVMLALGCLLASGRFPPAIVGAACVVTLLGNLLYLRYQRAAFQLLSRVVRKLLKRELVGFEISTALLLRLQAVHFLAQLVSAVGGYALCLAIGYRISVPDVLLVMAAIILADTAGFVFFLVPAGVGVREGTMYLLLRGASTSTLELVLPLVSRLLYMLADVLLGLMALAMLRRSIKSDPAANEAATPPSR